MPVASAVAAAAVTAKIQAMDAVATNLGLSSDFVMERLRDKPEAESSSVEPEDVGIKGQELPPQLVVQKLKDEPEPELTTIMQQQNIEIKREELPSQLIMQRFNDKPESEPTTIIKQENIEIKGLGLPSNLVMQRLRDKPEPESTTIMQQENMEIKGQSARHLLMHKLMRDKPEPVVIVLKNMVNPDEVDEELSSEIEDECGKYGEIERVIVYQEKQDESENAQVVVKIFVEFKDSASAKKAKETLHNRYFGGKLVIAQIYDQELYDNQDLSG